MNVDLFNLAFNKFRLPLLIFTKKYTATEAEDIVSNVFVKLWQLNLDFKTQAELKSWLFKTAKNAALDLKKSVYFTKFNPLSDLELADDDKRNIELAEIEHSIIVALNNAISMLTKAEQRIIDEYYIHKKTAAQIAECRGVNVSTIHNQLTTIRHKLIYLFDPILVNDYFNDAN